jgi:cytochrome d ubiquinol oxidase subunit I
MARGQLMLKRWLLHLAVWSIPLPWIASECGWIVAEYGRQPWSIAGVLPTNLSASSVSVAEVTGSLVSLGGLYTFLLVVDVLLILRYIRLGPSCLGTGRYRLERKPHGSPEQGAPA